MKYLIFSVFIVSVFAFSPIYGQLTGNNFSLGPRVGVNFSNVKDPEEAKVLTGLVAGLTSTYSINENSGITVDLLYSGEGYKMDNEDLRINYLRIPILYNLFLGQLGQSFRPKVFLGPEAGFLLSAKMNSVDFKSEMRGFTLGIGAGLGFNYQLADRIWLNLDARSFFDLFDVRDQRPSSSEKSAIRKIQVSLGIARGF